MTRSVLSASNFAAALLCAGKPQAEAMCAEPKRSACSLRGTNLHRYFRTTLDRNGLSVEDRDLLSRADRSAGQFICEFCAMVGTISQHTPETDEHEIELDGPVPGHADNILTWAGGKYAVILDLKTGMSEQEPAPSNWQIGIYSVNQWLRKPFEICGVAIISPDAFGPKRTSAIYRAKDMPDLLAAVEAGKARTVDPNAPRTPGEEQCYYCRAKVQCREYLQSLDTLAVLPDKTAVAQLSDAHLLALWRACKVADKIREEVDAELRRRDLEKLGLKYRNTGSTRTLFDPLAAHDAINVYLEQRGLEQMSAQAFDSCRRLSFGDLETMFASLTGYSAKKAKEELKHILSPYTVETPKEKAIVACS